MISVHIPIIFAVGNSVFTVEKVEEGKKLTIHCSKGPLRNKAIEVLAGRCPFVFGRAHEADLCIMDRELSRKHGRFFILGRRGGRRGFCAGRFGEYGE